MTNIYRDETYHNLVWVQFEGPTWNEFHDLMNDFERWTEAAQEPFYMVFYPTIDMPKGSPLPHIRRMIRYLANESKIVHMITILPKRMVIAKVFANLAMKLFTNQTMQSTILTDVANVYDAYHKAVQQVKS